MNQSHNPTIPSDFSDQIWYDIFRSYDKTDNQMELVLYKIYLPNSCKKKKWSETKVNIGNIQNTNRSDISESKEERRIVY